jgi:ribosome maturation factor RimP
MPPATAGASGAHTREQLVALLDPLVTAAGFDLEEITVSVAGRRSLVRVIVDADGGIDLDAVATISRIVSDALDDDSAGGVLAGSYVLEVSSPGIDRPLSDPRHWRRASGRLVTVQSKGQTVTGRIESTSDAGVELDVKGKRRTIAWADLGPGKVQIEFNRSEDE